MSNQVPTTPRSRILEKRKRDEKVRRLSRQVFRVMPWLQDADRPAVRAWAELEVLCEKAYFDLRENGLLRSDGSGEPRNLADLYQRLRRAQLAFSRELGMTVKARAEIASGSNSIPVDAAYERIERIRRQREDMDNAQEVDQS